MFLSKKDAGRYTAGVHFTEATLASPAKSKPKELATSRNILDLGKSTLKNIKKAVAIAEDYLNDGMLPSGSTWEDMYAHVKTEYRQQNPKENEMFMGFMAFVCLTKYNEVGVNHLTVMEINDDMVTKISRAEQRQQNKEERDTTRAFNSPGSRGIGLDRQMQIIEIAQMDDCKKIDNITETITGLTARCDIILRERSQQIELAKIISPVYDKDDENWAVIANLTQDLKEVKEQVVKFEREKQVLMTNTSRSSALTKTLLQNINSFGDSGRKETKVPKRINASDVTSSTNSSSITSYDEPQEIQQTSQSVNVVSRNDIDGNSEEHNTDELLTQESKVSN